MGSGGQTKLHLVHLEHCEELTSKVRAALEPASPGGRSVTDAEAVGLLTFSAQTVTPGAQELVLIERVRDAVATNGVDVVMDEEMLPRLRMPLGKNLFYELLNWLATWRRWKGPANKQNPDQLQWSGNVGVDQSEVKAELSHSS